MRCDNLLLHQRAQRVTSRYRMGCGQSTKNGDMASTKLLKLRTTEPSIVHRLLLTEFPGICQHLWQGRESFTESESWGAGGQAEGADYGDGLELRKRNPTLRVQETYSLAARAKRRGTAQPWKNRKRNQRSPSVGCLSIADQLKLATVLGDIWPSLFSNGQVRFRYLRTVWRVLGGLAVKTRRLHSVFEELKEWAASSVRGCCRDVDNQRFALIDPVMDTRSPGTCSFH